MGDTPVVIEDNAFIGAGCVVVEGVQVLKGAVLAPGVVLSSRIPVFDCVHQKIRSKGAPIPPEAVLVPGTRPLGLQNTWAREQGLHLHCPLIVKYRDQKSQASLELEELLR